MSDIVERLRDDPQRNFSEAIDEIGRLRVELDAASLEVQRLERVWETSTQKEIERLRTNYDLLADDYRQLLIDNERLRQENERILSDYADLCEVGALAKANAEIERLREKSERDDKLLYAETEKVYLAEKEIERLRGENKNLRLEMRSLLQVTIGRLTDVEIQRDYGMLGWSVVKRCEEILCA